MSAEDIKLIKRGIPIYLMILPGLLYFIIFKYIPMGGAIIAFKEYDPFVGFIESPWVGLANFQRLFGEEDFLNLLRNTLTLSTLNLFLYFPFPIILALLLHEVNKSAVRRTIQTVLYMPHFISWVIVVSITVLLFGTQSGSINNVLAANGFDRLPIMTAVTYFRPMYLFQNIWKDTGWAAVIFLAALASVDPTLYEAAIVDGASRWQQLWYINLPSIKSTIIILFILRIGHVMESGFEHILLLQNSMNLSVSDVFDTYVYRNGILSGQFSYTTTIGLFKGLVGLLLIVTANQLAKKAGEEGIY